MAQDPIYPLGHHDFTTIIEDGFVYVDKTQYIQTLLENGVKYGLLARPRRFGKSLFLSTLRYFFEGKRQLFKGLAINSYDDWDWAEYPVLYLDFSGSRCQSPSELDSRLDAKFNSWENKYGVKEKAQDFSYRFYNIIRKAHEKTGKRVVILVDEYDKPLVCNLSNEKIYQHNENILANVYANFKSRSEHIEMVFLTALSTFFKNGALSVGDNIDDITFDEDYADICGFTEKELHENFNVGIQELAEYLNKSNDETRQMLKDMYGGYRFADYGSELYLPNSLLLCLRKNKICNYFYDYGIPTLVREATVDVDLDEIFDYEWPLDALKGWCSNSMTPVAFMCQLGYLTIKAYNKKRQRYRLGFPNTEVREFVFDLIASSSL